MFNAFASPMGSLSVEFQKPTGYAKSKATGMKKNTAAKMHGQTNSARPFPFICFVISRVPCPCPAKIESRSCIELTQTQR